MKKIEEARILCDEYRLRLNNLTVSRFLPTGKKRTRIISVSDLHVPFFREDLIKWIIKRHSGTEICVVNGDLFDNYLISTFSKNKEIPFAIEYVVVSNIVRELADHFEQVILIDGNHDKNRYQREMAKVNPTLSCLIKKSPLKYIADGVTISRSGEEMSTRPLPNVLYAGDIGQESWWMKIGQCLFVHRLSGFKNAPMANAIHANNWFIDRGTKFQAIVNGHSHRVGWTIHKRKLVIDQGCLCYPMDYEANGKMTMAPVDLGYAVIELDKNGNIYPQETRPIYLGTYQVS